MTIQDDAHKMMFEDLQSIPALKAEIERLKRERDDFLEQLAIRSPSGIEKNMQAVMKRSNELLAENERLHDIIKDLNDCIEKQETELSEWKKTQDMVTERDMEITVLRAALTFYRDARVARLLQDGGRIARAALEGKK